MTTADASTTQVSYVPETILGTTPTTPVFQRMRVTSENLTGEQNSVTSQELTPAGGVTDLIRVGESAAGATPFELSFGPDWDTLFEHALRGTFSGSELKAGIELKSMTMEKIIQGTALDYLRYRGCRVGQLNLAFNSEEIITGDITILGIGEDPVDSAIIPGATYTPANSNPVMAAADVGSISIGGVSGQMFYSSITLALDNQVRLQPALETIQAIGIGYGTQQVTGQISAYWENKNLYERAVNNDVVAISWQATDGTNTYTFTLPKCKFSARGAPSEGQNQDVFATVDYQALRDDAVENTWMIITNGP